MVGFRISTFILPKGCIKKIESLRSRFLWSGDIDRLHTAKVTWSTVCLPKAEGGLGLRSFSTWNRVICLRFIWLLLSESESLWVQWHITYHLQNTNLWALECKQHDSWTWTHLLKLRQDALRFCKYVIGDGRKINFWYDIWTPFGQLISWIGTRGPLTLRVPLLALVSQACTNDRWLIASPRSEEALALHIYLTTIPLPSSSTVCDKLEWVIDGVSGNIYQAAKTWEVMIPRDKVKDWSQLVWYKEGIPKHMFNMWIANYNRLPTRSRLADWGLQVPINCPFCLQRWRKLGIT